MTSKLYPKIKKLMYFAKETFLDKNGKEITPGLDKLVDFEARFNTVQKDLMKLEEELTKIWST